MSDNADSVDRALCAGVPGIAILLLNCAMPEGHVFKKFNFDGAAGSFTLKASPFGAADKVRT